MYTKVDRKNEMKSPEQRFEVMMTGLNTSVLQQFWKEENNTGAETTRRMGIDKIIPGIRLIFGPTLSQTIFPRLSNRCVSIRSLWVLSKRAFGGRILLDDSRDSRKRIFLRFL